MELTPAVQQLLDAARARLRSHFRERASLQNGEFLQSLKSDGAYPYPANEPKSVVERVERQVFDVLATHLGAHLPGFDTADVKAKKFTLQMVKHALETGPSEIRRIFDSVLDLEPEKQAELAALLERTTLEAIIDASKVIADRLDFIKGLGEILFDPKHKRHFKERSQLHRILVGNTWLFGEEFNLTADDESLTKVLEVHKEAIGRAADEPLAPVLRHDGTVGIVDMMLSRVLKQPRADEREHLVIELKRPIQKINTAVQMQLQSYAFAVINDERFRDTKTRWTFWAVSNEMDGPTRAITDGTGGKPRGQLAVLENGRATLWAKTWGELLAEAEARLEFFRERLDYAAKANNGLQLLQTTYDKYIPASAGGALPPQRKSAAPKKPRKKATRHPGPTRA